jgi:hypothetical protein
VEEVVHKAIQAHRAAGSDELARMAPLSQLLGYLSSNEILRSVCTELAETRRFIEYAYLHKNGFFVLYLTDPDIGLQVRLHVWSPSHPPRHEQPHRHRMAFVSRVLTGVLRSTVFERVSSPLPSAGIELFQELCIEGPARSDFDENRTVLKAGSTVGLRPVQQLVHRAGDTYRFPAAGIHRVDALDDLAEPLITLSVWEPAFQPSIAYEPPEPIAHVKTMAVHRLTTALYDEVLGLVLATLREPT